MNSYARARACTVSCFKDEDQEGNPFYKIRYRVVKFEDIIEIISRNELRGLRFVIRAVLNVDYEDGLIQIHNNMQTPQLHQRHVLGHTLFGSTEHKDNTKDLPILTTHHNFYFIHLYNKTFVSILQLKLSINYIDLHTYHSITYTYM